MDTTVTVTVTDTVSETDTVSGTVLEEKDFVEFLKKNDITEEQYKQLPETEQEYMVEKYVLRR